MPASVLTELIVAKEKQFCLQRHGGICLHIGIGCPPLSRYLSSKRHRANRAFALEWKDTTGSEWYCLSWVTSRELHCCAILFPKLDFLKAAPIVWFSYLSQQLQSAWIAQQLIDPTAQKEVCETLLVTWIICIFANSGCFFSDPQLLCHCSQSLFLCSVTAVLQPSFRWPWRVGAEEVLKGRWCKQPDRTGSEQLKWSFSSSGGIQRACTFSSLASTWSKSEIPPLVKTEGGDGVDEYPCRPPATRLP